MRVKLRQILEHKNTDIQAKLKQIIEHKKYRYTSKIETNIRT